MLILGIVTILLVISTFVFSVNWNRKIEGRDKQYSDKKFIKSMKKYMRSNSFKIIINLKGHEL